MEKKRAWQSVYASKLVSAEEAVSKIKSGDRIVIGCTGVEPEHLVKAMVANYEAYEEVEICRMLTLSKGLYTTPEMEGHFRLNAFFLDGNTRECVVDNRGNFTPAYFHEIPYLFAETLPVDVLMVMLSKPDKHGYCSFSVSCDYAKTLSNQAKMVIAQINECMPRTFGDNFIHIKDLDYIVEYNQPMAETGTAVIGEVEKQIGAHCASLIQDGDTLQLGIGSIPESVLTFLGDRKDLGLHTEMASDGVVDLIEAGIINNKRKNIHRGKSITTFAMGTKKIYDFVDDNPQFEFYPVEYVNDPRVIAMNDNVVSINGCIQVDLMGQVVSDSIGLKQFSGVGGQVDFVRGAAMSKGGRSIIATTSTAAKGKISRIVPFIDQGAAVTTSRNDVHYIVTEYGIANLKGRSARERAKALIAIAHPDFRGDLQKEYVARFGEK